MPENDNGAGAGAGAGAATGTGAGGNGNGGANSNIPDGYFSQAQLDETVRARLARDRSARLNDSEYRKKALETWKQDEKVFGEVQTILGVRASGKPTGDEVEQIKAGVLKEHVEPLQTKLTDAEKENTLLRGDRLKSAILEGAEEIGVLKAFRTSVGEADPAIVTMLAANFAWDPETRKFYVKKGDGFEYSKLEGQTWMSPREFLDGWAKSDAAKELLDPKVRTGAGISGNLNGRTTGRVSFDDFKKMSDSARAEVYTQNADLYRTLMAQLRTENEGSLGKSFA